MFKVGAAYLVVAWLAAQAAGLAPIRFGRDLILDPVETTGNLFSGIANMFDRAVSEVEQADASHDDFVDSLAGVSKATRDLAFELKVDPYTDFTPLRDGLADRAPLQQQELDLAVARVRMRT